MKKQIAYQLIEASNPSELEEFVNTAIGNGWVCQGGFYSTYSWKDYTDEPDEAIYYQAMVKYED